MSCAGYVDDTYWSWQESYPYGGPDVDNLSVYWNTLSDLTAHKHTLTLFELVSYKVPLGLRLIRELCFITFIEAKNNFGKYSLPSIHEQMYNDDQWFRLLKDPEGRRCLVSPVRRGQHVVKHPYFQTLWPLQLPPHKRSSALRFLIPGYSFGTMTSHSRFPYLRMPSSYWSLNR